MSYTPPRLPDGTRNPTSPEVGTFAEKWPWIQDLQKEIGAQQYLIEDTGTKYSTSGKVRYEVRFFNSAGEPIPGFHDGIIDGTGYRVRRKPKAWVEQPGRPEWNWAAERRLREQSASIREQRTANRGRAVQEATREEDPRPARILID
jgi:hypothetical protein